MRCGKSIVVASCGTLRFGLVVLALVGSAIAASEARAASVTYELVLDPHSANYGCVGCTLDGAGTWDLYASASQGDNFGLAAYQLSLVNVASAFNRSPRTLLTVDPAGIDPEPQPAGFTLLRTGNNVTPIKAAQDTATPTPYLIRGLGQTAGSFATAYPGTFISGPSNQETSAGWAAKLLLAEGTYDSFGTLPSFAHSDVSIAGVFQNDVNELTMAAEVFTTIVKAEAPEPTTMSMLGLALVGFTVMSRRTRTE